VAHVVIVGWAFSNLEKSICPGITAPTASRVRGDLTLRVTECEVSSWVLCASIRLEICRADMAEAKAAVRGDSIASMSAFRGADRPIDFVAHWLRELCNRSTTFTQPSCKRAIY
jgi:hypothetical protein